MGNSETCRPLIQNEFSRIDDLCQLFQQRLDGARVGDQIVDDLRPSLV